jgi:hypothetical protein
MAILIQPQILHSQKTLFDKPTKINQNLGYSGFIDAKDYGFSPESSGIENATALQNALDNEGTIIVSQPGVYKIARTVYIGSNTSFILGNNVFLEKTNEMGLFTHVLLNKGALTKQYDSHISVIGLQIRVNGMDKPMSEVYGLRGQLAFFYVKDLKIERFRCLDLENMQFGIHVCTFEDLLIEDVIIKGKKDGIHLGRGYRFTIRDGIFETYDDAIALNAHDYATSNPEMGWIENGIVENCHDLNADNTVGYFCRILAGGWIDWKSGMEVQHSDAVVSNGKIYRVHAQPDDKLYNSINQPIHEAGSRIIDGINWSVVQDDITYTAGVRNVTFRDIFLYKPRVAFSLHFDVGKYSRSYYPGAEVPIQKNISFENIRILYEENKDFLSVSTPVNAVSITNSSFGKGGISFKENNAMKDYLKTKINIINCTFNYPGTMVLLRNNVSNKQIDLKSVASIELYDNFSAKVISKEEQIIIDSDLTGLKK